MAKTSRTLLCSAAGSTRRAAAVAWLAAQPRDRPLLVVAASLASANHVLRAAAAGRPSTFGWYRESLATLTAKLAALPLIEAGLIPAGRLALEAVAVRVVFEMREHAALGRFARVADRPGLARALARTLGELGMAGVAPDDSALEPDLARLYARYRAVLSRFGFADRAQQLAHATHALQRSAEAFLAVPTLLWDVSVESRAEASFVSALIERTSDCFASVPARDARSLRYLQAALGVAPTSVAELDCSSSLRRLQHQLFEAQSAGGELGEEVAMLSAPGEAREAVEIARRIAREAERGVAFDRMAVLLRAPELYRAPLVEALRRAAIPAYFSEGALRPEPSGRALLALLACADEGLSARRFAEYLSLGVLPKLDPSGAPPPAQPRSERFVAPADETFALGSANLEDSDAETHSAQANGSLATPRRWERLLVDAAVLGGRARWERRLDGLERELTLELRPLLDAEEPRTAAIARDLDALRALRGFALPLIAELDGLPARALWGEWLDILSALVTRAIAQPAALLQGLSELAPLAEVGPVDLAEVRAVLERRFGDVRVRSARGLEGKVFVGTIAEARGLVFDVVFVPGLAEKIFPPRLAEDPLLLDAERQQISPELVRADDRLAAERCALELAVGAADARLVASYPRFASERARPRVPSFYALELLRAATGAIPSFDELVRIATNATQSRMGWPAPQESRDAIDDAEYDLVVLGTLLGKDPHAVKGAGHYLLSANPHLARALRFRARRWLRPWFSADGLVKPGPLAQTALARHALSARAYSATALEKFAACPYRFYLSAIAGLAPRKQLEPVEVLEPMKRGVLIHETLRRFLTFMREADRLPLERDGLELARTELARALDEIAAHYHEELAPAIERVWEDGILEIAADLREWLLRATEERSWTPAYFELGFGLREGELDVASQPEAVALGNGLRLRGAIDLVERNGNALRATDYKTGRAPERTASVIDGGRQLQPLLYALALERLFPGFEVTAGRAYYCTSRGAFRELVVPLDAHAQKVAARLAETIGSALEHGFFPAAPVEGACERCEFRPLCGPYEEQRILRKDQAPLEALHRLRSEP